jgi:hypothetical protein
MCMSCLLTLVTLLCFAEIGSCAVRLSLPPSAIRNNPPFNQTGKLTVSSNANPFEKLEHALPGDKFRGWDDESFDAVNNFFWMKEGGIILEMGALDGLRYSVSRDFLPFSWHRILIEATPKWHHLAATNSPDATYIAAAICESNSDVHFLLRPNTDNAINGIAEFMSKSFMKEMHPYIYKEAMKTGTFDLQSIDWGRFHDRGYNHTNGKHSEIADIMTSFVHNIPCVRLTDVLAYIKVEHVNFFVLDVEGAELSVLKGMDFSSLSIDIICVEDVGFRDPGYADEIRKLLTKQGYVFLFDKGRNSWFRFASFVPSSRAAWLSEKDKERNKRSTDGIGVSLVAPASASVDNNYSTVSTKGLRVGHFSNHLGALRDQAWIFERLGMDVSDFFIRYYDVTAKFAGDYFREHMEVINAFDIVITSDTTPLSRIFLQNLSLLKPRLVIWVCNRLDYDVHDEAYISLTKEALARRDSKVIYIPYTEYEKNDALERLGVSLTACPTITPHGLQISDVTMTEEVGRHYSLKVAGTSKAKIDLAQLKKEGKGAIFVTRYQNDQRHVGVPKLFDEHQILYVSGSYSHPDQLRDYSAVVTFPDAMSKFLTFETIQYGVVVVLPSMSWLEKLVHTSKYFFNGDNMGNQPKRALWYENEWYRFPECRIYVSSVDELVEVARQLNDNTYPHLAYLKRNMKERAKTLADIVFKKWEIIYSASLNSGKSAVFRKVYDVDVIPMQTCLASKKILSGSRRFLPESKSESRFESFLISFQLLLRSVAQPKVVVQMGLGFTSSTAEDKKFDVRLGWGQKDWRGVGFTRLASECNQHVDGLQLLVLDVLEDSLREARAASQNYSFVSTLVSSSAQHFFQSYSGAPITLLYIDIDTAVSNTSSFRFQIEEARILTKLRETLLAEEAYVLLDDVNFNLSADQFPHQRESHQKNGVSKNLYGKYSDSITHMLSRGWDIAFAGDQWILKAPPLPSFNV